jgi:endonuclease YncB( thermonuclease family)
VIDGDTLVVRLDGHEMIVELDGIDAPELGQPLGREIRGLVRDLVRGREVVVELTGGNSPGCARVAVDGLDLSQLLVERGLAWATDGGPLAESSARAKSARCGIWIEPEPVPPWEFRQIVG